MTTPSNKQLREFIVDVFNASELNTFCFDHFEDVDIPDQLGMNEKAVMLIRYCKRRELTAVLLVNLQQARPLQYQRAFDPQAETPVVEVAAPAPTATPVPSATAIPANETSFIHEKTGMEFMRVWAGEFQFGDYEDEITLDLPEFWISKTPVTQAVYKRFIDANPQHPVPYGDDDDECRPHNWDQRQRTFPPDKADHPVVFVSWYDAITFCEWAELQLPTEEQWEKAARGMGGRIYPWGNEEPTDKLCNFNENVGGTTAVYAYSPQGDSPYGCVDMNGNVAEWCLNKWNGDVGIDETNDARGLRGGLWASYAEEIYAALHDSLTPDSFYPGIGFRVVMARRSPSE